MIRSKLNRPLLLSVLAVSGLAVTACGQAETPANHSPAETAPAAQVAPATASAFSGVEALVGKTPSESGLFTTSPIAPSLQALLGDHFAAFTTNFQVESPLQNEQGVLYTSGNKQGEGGTEQAYLLIHPETNALEVGLWQKGKLTTYKTQGSNIAKPADVQTMISNAAS